MTAGRYRHGKGINGVAEELTVPKGAERARLRWLRRYSSYLAPLVLLLSVLITISLTTIAPILEPALLSLVPNSADMWHPDLLHSRFTALAEFWVLVYASSMLFAFAAASKRGQWCFDFAREIVTGVSVQSSPAPRPQTHTTLG